MARALSRLGTKLGGVLGNVERTQYDKKILDGIKRYQDSRKQAEHILSDSKDTLPHVGGMSNVEKLSQAKMTEANRERERSASVGRFSMQEKAADKYREGVPRDIETLKQKITQTLKQTASLYGGGVPITNGLLQLAEALTKVGAEERKLVKTCAEKCNANFDTFIKTSEPSFMKEKEILDSKTLDMDGAKNNNRKSPSNDNDLKQTTATNAFQNQRRTLEMMIDQIPKHDESLAISMKAYSQALLEFHTKAAELLLSVAKLL